jgi:PHD/YefM family antitoxin component YafN of YafNO toxin-antitoxin module
MTSHKSSKNLIHEQASILLGVGTEIMGNTQARQGFLPLVEDLKKHPRTIEITDRANPVAVLLTYDHYVSLISQLSKLIQKTATKEKVDLMGSVVIVEDLDAASKEIAEEFVEAVDRSAANL